jgi:hypothetical protein
MVRKRRPRPTDAVSGPCFEARPGAAAMRDHDHSSEVMRSEVMRSEVMGSEVMGSEVIETSAPEAAAAGILGTHYRTLRRAVGAGSATDDRSPAASATVAAGLVLRVLAERARRRLTASPARAAEIGRLRRALQELAEEEPRQAEVLSLHEVAGLEVDEIASMLEIPAEDAERDLHAARAWLARRVTG